MASNRSSSAAAILLFFLSLLSLSNPTIAYANPALDDVVLFPGSSPSRGFAPRFYQGATPPIPPLLLDKRQDDGDQQVIQCPTDTHGCLEVGPDGAGACCRNDQYCFLNSTWGTQCCGLGTTCDAPCPENLLYCNATSTSTATVSTTLTDAADAGATTPSAVLTLIPTEIPVPTCCGRACRTSYFRCQAQFGGQCCPYGGTCVSESGCRVPETSSSSTSPLVTAAPPGCTTSQIACAASQGGGCCDVGSTCTSVQTGAMTTVSQVCAPNMTVADGGSGLSSQARGGIGAGVAIAAAAVIGLLTWFCLRRRSEAARARSGEGAGAIGTAYAAGAGGEDREPERRSLMPYNRGVVAPAMSDVSGPTSTGVGSGGGGGGGGSYARPVVHASGLTYDYFGPDAVSGPFTESADNAPGRGSSLGVAFGRTGVPVLPRDPGDIVPPVEIDSRTKGDRKDEGEKGGLGIGSGGRGGNEGVPSMNVTPAPEEPQQQGGPFELPGSPGSPSPLSPSEVRSHHEASSPYPGLGYR